MTAYSAFDWLQRLRSFRRFHVVISHRHLPPRTRPLHGRVRPAADGRAGPFRFRKEPEEMRISKSEIADLDLKVLNPHICATTDDYNPKRFEFTIKFFVAQQHAMVSTLLDKECGNHPRVFRWHPCRGLSSTELFETKTQNVPREQQS
jgi:hypothetical protein